MTHSTISRNLYQNQLTQERFGLQVAARLSDASEQLPHDISERLRAARMQALAKRKIVNLSTAARTMALVRCWSVPASMCLVVAPP